MTKLFLSVVFSLWATVAAAQPAIGSAQGFAVLGASTVTNTGATVATGHVGVSPGTAITGFPPGVVVDGALHAGDMVAAQAHADASVAYATAKALECLPANNLTGQDLGTMVLPPATYCFDSSAQLTGTLLLTGAGPWVFQIGSTLTTSTASAVVLETPANCTANRVLWQVGSSATLGTGTLFTGTVLALASITATTGVQVSGRLLALTGAVTLDTNLVTACGTLAPPTPPICQVPDDDDDDHGDHDGHGKDCKRHHDRDGKHDRDDRDHDHRGKKGRR